jgi:hypothetical protein
LNLIFHIQLIIVRSLHLEYINDFTPFSLLCITCYDDDFVLDRMMIRKQLLLSDSKNGLSEEGREHMTHSMFFSNFTQGSIILLKN